MAGPWTPGRRRRHHGPVPTVPVPTNGGVVVGRDRAGRAIRVSSHPEVSRVVLSLWDGGRCIGTMRMAPEDVPDLVKMLAGAAVATSEDGGRSPVTGGGHLTAVPPAS